MLVSGSPGVERAREEETGRLLTRAARFRKAPGKPLTNVRGSVPEIRLTRHALYKRTHSCYLQEYRKASPN